MSHLNEFEKFVNVVEALRGPNGCPWDKKQTHKSLARWAIEESYELEDAILENDLSQIKGELGDILLQVVLHSVIAQQDHSFTLKEVIQNITEKMIRRHPHVFTDQKASLDEVYENWEKIKNKEKKSTPINFNISKSLPALLMSQKIGEKTRAQNFDWEAADDVFKKVQEELDELKSAIKENSTSHTEEEFGDLLFSLSQWGRHMGIESEQALKMANQKFEKRYFKMKELIEKDGHNFANMSQSDKDKYWEQAKKINSEAVF